MSARALAALSFTCAFAASPAPLPLPLSFWRFQEATGAPRLGDGFGATSSSALLEGNASAPMERVAGGVFGAFSVRFDGGGGFNNSRRLAASRAAAPALTVALGGPNATVTVVAWVRALAQGWGASALVAGVWNEHAAARQYALFTKLPACDSAPVYAGGVAGHASNVGGPTPGDRFCETRACDPRPLPRQDWQCLAMAYDGAAIYAFLNGTLLKNGNDNPFAYPGGLFSPEAAGRVGAEFAVGANLINTTVGGLPHWSNLFEGDVGGLAVFAEGLADPADVARICAFANGF
jgi:hypothetical protein